MGLFYSALEKATQAGEAPAAAAPAADWSQAEVRDLAGFPLVPEPGAPAPPAPADAPTQLDPHSLSLIANHAGIAKEQYRILRTRLLEAIATQGLRSLLISSATAGEGKTIVSANLALQFSSLKEGRILLVDADLRRAGLSESLRPQPTRGLGEYLRGEADWESLLLQVDPWLTVLPAVLSRTEGAELLTSQRLPELLQQARTRFDLVLVDGAPVGPVADSRVLARAVDASVLVVRAGCTNFTAVEEAAALLRPGLLGCVLNGAKLARNRYGYGYSYIEDAATEVAADGEMRA
ncbi:MAG TPA: CpsD/CapB family tyrosine-protein kinase [Terriglobales bacterium]|jgi:capsular exopolysaccharide synthesis family protein